MGAAKLFPIRDPVTRLGFRRKVRAEICRISNSRRLRSETVSVPGTNSSCFEVRLETSAERGRGGTVSNPRPRHPAWVRSQNSRRNLPNFELTSLLTEDRFGSTRVASEPSRLRGGRTPRGGGKKILHISAPCCDRFWASLDTRGTCNSRLDAVSNSNSNSRGFRRAARTTGGGGRLRNRPGN